MTGSEDDRPDEAGIRPLKAVVRNGRVYLDMESLVSGYRSRADALEERGYHDVASLYRREADELDVAAIGWLTEGSNLTELTPPPAVIHLTKRAAEMCGNHLHRLAWAVGEVWGKDEGAILSGTDDAGKRVSLDIRVDAP